MANAVWSVRMAKVQDSTIQTDPNLVWPNRKLELL